MMCFALQVRVRGRVLALFTGRAALAAILQGSSEGLEGSRLHRPASTSTCPADISVATGSAGCFDCSMACQEEIPADANQ
jgi:hypothetical protein